MTPSGYVYLQVFFNLSYWLLAVSRYFGVTKKPNLIWPNIVSLYQFLRTPPTYNL